MMNWSKHGERKWKGNYPFSTFQLLWTYPLTVQPRMSNLFLIWISRKHYKHSRMQNLKYRSLLSKNNRSPACTSELGITFKILIKLKSRNIFFSSVNLSMKIIISTHSNLWQKTGSSTTKIYLKLLKTATLYSPPMTTSKCLPVKFHLFHTIFKNRRVEFLININFIF